MTAKATATLSTTCTMLKGVPGYSTELVSDSQSIGITIDVANLEDAKAWWNNAPVSLSAAGLVHHQVVCEVIWELMEINYRMEFITLDAHLVPEPQGETEEDAMAREIWLQREAEILRCWPGLPYRPQYSSPGPSSMHSPPSRIPFIKAFYQVVQYWPGPKPALLRQPFPLEVDQSALESVEKVLVNYYTPLSPTMFMAALTMYLFAENAQKSSAASMPPVENIVSAITFCAATGFIFRVEQDTVLLFTHLPFHPLPFILQLSSDILYPPSDLAYGLKPTSFSGKPCLAHVINLAVNAVKPSEPDSAHLAFWATILDAEGPLTPLGQVAMSVSHKIKFGLDLNHLIAEDVETFDDMPELEPSGPW
ncbi:hypothetical protein BDP27DRAFT_1373542 [Rhodocollybia butyracea]|uniref:Uncharacterized protein n=1 Tax=Rhodocollybia butyracea TaxID=206335 RepID=A0A9P5P6Y4_9AGAR|nr:hypothetical protein BDP27DRAFT_1373542 [Rhodocollybia butyracea]